MALNVYMHVYNITSLVHKLLIDEAKKINSTILLGH